MPAEFAWDDPSSDVVLLDGGPSPLRGFHYRDWLATRAATRRLRVPLDRPDGSPRRYAPTTELRTDEDTGVTTRIWRHINASQWQAWGREYLTPEEQPTNTTDHRRAAA